MTLFMKTGSYKQYDAHLKVVHVSQICKTLWGSRKFKIIVTGNDSLHVCTFMMANYEIARIYCNNAMFDFFFFFY